MKYSKYFKATKGEFGIVFGIVITVLLLMAEVAALTNTSYWIVLGGGLGIGLVAVAIAIGVIWIMNLLEDFYENHRSV